MIRFILKREINDRISGAKYERLFTMDIEAPELERELTSGGLGQEAYDMVSLVGCEVLRSNGDGK